MCKICKDWESKKISTMKAYMLIKKALEKSQDKLEKLHLIKLSDIILDSDLPINEGNPEAEAAFWRATHKQEDDEG